MREAREAYIDMARVWHPDRFTENPRLRKKVEEKLKEINLAYAQIKALLSTEPGRQRTEKRTPWAQRALEAISGNILALKKVTRFLCSFACSTFRETDFKRIFQNGSRPGIEPGETANRKSKSTRGISRRTEPTNMDRKRHKKFADIYEEVARDREEARKKT